MANELSSTTQWVLGIILTLSMSIGGYSINQSISNEARLTANETDLNQAQEELIELWGHYNTGLEEKEKIHITLATIAVRLKSIEEKVDELK